MNVQTKAFRADQLFSALKKEFPEIPDAQLTRYISHAESIALVMARVRHERLKYLRATSASPEEALDVDAWGEVIAMAFNLGSAEWSSESRGGEGFVLKIARIARQSSLMSPEITLEMT
jgi:hypothetical protein